MKALNIPKKHFKGLPDIRSGVTPGAMLSGRTTSGCSFKSYCSESNKGVDPLPPVGRSRNSRSSASSSSSGFGSDCWRSARSLAAAMLNSQSPW
ncbi:MAG: hypothetical protein U1C97_00425 [Candidatus Gracilibacteria bacterium]|nr:hypothetical protein [Candidatus Gracilibacteria bacterium]